MLGKLRSRLTYANVMATVAVFLALGGGAYAAVKFPANSVGSKQLKNKAVTPAKVAPATAALLKGQKGDTGPQGQQGIQGVQGLQGVQGDRGPSDVFYATDPFAGMSLPPGDYIVFAKATFNSNGGTPKAGLWDCSFQAGGPAFDFSDQSYSPGGWATDFMTGHVHFDTTRTLNLGCEHDPTTSGSDTGTISNPVLQAIKVGSATAK